MTVHYTTHSFGTFTLEGDALRLELTATAEGLAIRVAGRSPAWGDRWAQLFPDDDTRHRTARSAEELLLFEAGAHGRLAFQPRHPSFPGFRPGFDLELEADMWAPLATAIPGLLNFSAELEAFAGELDPPAWASSSVAKALSAMVLDGYSPDTAVKMAFPDSIPAEMVGLKERTLAALHVRYSPAAVDPELI